MARVHRSLFVALTVCALASAPAPPQALWLDDAGGLRVDAQEAIALLAGAADDGLDPADYPVPAPGAASFDSDLTASILRYLHDLYFGRVDPHALGFRIAPRETVDLPAMLRDAVASHRLRALTAELSPRIPLYGELRASLPRYRALAADPRLRVALPPATIRPGEHAENLEPLRRLLRAIGDLAGDEETDGDPFEYEPSLVAAVERFQRRHGLEPDGVLGASTRRALAVPLDARVRQIEFSLERLRWLPRLPEQRVLAVNIPMFRAWGMGDRTVPPFATDVIVGRALNTRTPILMEQMEYVIFRPYWNVPSSILRHEILPAIRRSPDYLQRHAMEIVSGQSDAAAALPMTRENIDRLAGGRLRVRQRPGPQNSLGLVKFVFPNDANVYMHGTPAEELFARARRDFSHGCIRVADPVGLAEWVLAREPGWGRERIVLAMNGAGSMRVDLGRPMPVILFYLTAMPQTGWLHFADDIYGHDARLAGYLAARARGARSMSSTIASSAGQLVNS